MIRSVLFAPVLAVLLAAGAAQPANADDTGNLAIELRGLEPQGAILLQLFDSETGYQRGDGVAAARIEVTGDTARIAFADLPAGGQYAFRLFHDVNGDGEFNTNPFGMPIEPYAFSNGARGHFGPAVWADAAFTLNAGDNVQQIDLGAR